MPATKRNKPAAQPADPNAGSITDIDVENELADSFMEYALAVIISRAIPDARDGLKPVQRRILYSMLESGLRADKPHRKSVSAVGDTMKNYHPHGDSAIYDTLVRMAQTWSLQQPLIDGHGNFGSMDDPAAAARYTEARLANAAELLLADVDENTVDMTPNFEQTRDEPTVLPAAFPNLLVNGATGIAVGMATEIPPHNISEATNAALHLLNNPKATLDELMVHIPAPDFPTGGIIVGTDGIKDAYTTGKGKFALRARATIEDISARRRGIVITELPYTVGPERVITKIKQLVNQKRIDGISDIKDLSDRHTGLRLVIECKTGFNTEAILAALYRLTPLQISINVNAVALISGRPEQCSLHMLLNEFIRHRVEVVVRRTQYRLDRAEARMHIVEGLLTALNNIDDVIAIIRASKTTETAKANLRKKLKLSDIQATHILEMPLRKLTSLEVRKLNDEHTELAKQIRGYNATLKSPKRQREIVGNELESTGQILAASRRSEIIDKDDTPPPAPTKIAPDTLTLDDTPCDVIAFTDGNIARINTVSEQPARRKKVTPLTGIRTTTTTQATICAITTDGRAVAIPVAELPEIDEHATRPKKAAVGAPADAFIDLNGAAIIGFAHHGAVTAIATSNGTVKRLAADGWPTAQALERTGGGGTEVIKLSANDHVVAATPADDSTHLMFITSQGKLLRTEATNVRPQGKTSAGMAGIKLATNDNVICFAAIPAQPETIAHHVAVATDSANTKITAAHDYPEKGRNTGGVRCIAFKKADNKVAAASVLNANHDEIAAIDKAGNPAEIDTTPAKRDASGTPASRQPATFTIKP